MKSKTNWRKWILRLTSGQLRCLVIWSFSPVLKQQYEKCCLPMMRLLTMSCFSADAQGLWRFELLWGCSLCSSFRWLPLGDHGAAEDVASIWSNWFCALKLQLPCDTHGGWCCDGFGFTFHSSTKECVFLKETSSSMNIDQTCCSDLTCDPGGVIEPSGQHSAANDIASLGIKPSSPFWIRELNSPCKGKGSNFNRNRSYK